MGAGQCLGAVVEQPCPLERPAIAKPEVLQLMPGWSALFRVGAKRKGWLLQWGVGKQRAARRQDLLNAHIAA